MTLFKTLTGVFRPGKAPSDQPRRKIIKRPAEDTQKQQELAGQLLQEAQSKAREILVEAKDESLKIKQQAENQAQKLQEEFARKQAEIFKQEAETAKTQAANQTKQAQLTKLERQLEDQRKDLEDKRKAYTQKLQHLSNLTKEQAREFIFDTLKKRLRGDLEKTIQQAQAKAREESKEKAKEILVEALKHGATDYVAEYTVSTVKLPNEESKGRIIGKEGRNIRAFEKVTGVDIDLDETPGEIRLSSFDPIRREIARVTLSRLLADGRIQPTRIEEYVKKARNELEKTMFEEGKKLCHAVDVYNLPRDLVSKLGQYKYHFNQGQNLIAHTLEKVKIGVALAEEIGADVDTVRLGCLLHDIGIVLYEEEGGHVDLGVKLLRKFNMPSRVVDTVANHHNPENQSSSEAVIVSVAAAISTSRPGAQYKDYDELVKRLNKLEDVARSFDGVADAYVLQAGREVRVIVKPERINDEGLTTLAFEIKEKIRDEMAFPGAVTVTLVRESRAAEVAN